MENLDRDKYVQDMAAATTEDDKKRVKIEFEQMEMKLRRRSLGNIRQDICYLTYSVKSITEGSIYSIVDTFFHRIKWRILF